MKAESIEQITPHPGNATSSKVLRFRKSERLLHWALAVPFLVCLSSALVLVVHYNPDPTRPYRAFFAATHRIGGIAFIVLPLLATLISKGDFRIHFYNIRQAWIWTLHDIKWLFLMGFAAICKNIVLPDQGKFNAAEKINFMYLMSTYSFYVLTGFFIWITDAAFLAWIAHCFMAIMSLPLIFGHLYMATINSGSRVGLSGMFSGYVCRHWAKHHYTKWYQEHYGEEHQDISVTQQGRERFCQSKKPQPVAAPPLDPGKDTHTIALEILDRIELKTAAESNIKRAISPAGDNSKPQAPRAKSIEEGVRSQVIPLQRRRSA